MKRTDGKLTICGVKIQIYAIVLPDHGKKKTILLIIVNHLNGDSREHVAGKRFPWSCEGNRASDVISRGNEDLH